MEEEKKVIETEVLEEKKEKEDSEEEKLNFLPLFAFCLFLIVIFQFFYIVSLKRKISDAKVLGGSAKIVEDLSQTRGYLKKLYEAYKCENFYDPSTSTTFQIYNLFYCLKEKGEKK
jgi:hypothetical protein